MATVIAGLVFHAPSSSADNSPSATIVPILLPSNAASTVLQNDEPVQFHVPDGDLAPHAAVRVYECDDPTGSTSAVYLATLDKYTCDGVTNRSFVTNNDGGLTTPDPASDPNDAWVLYSLPNAADLGESTSNSDCDLSDECIIYIGPSLQDPDDGPGVVYSTPFFVDQHFDYENGNAAPAGTVVATTTSGPATTTTTTTNSTTKTTAATSTTTTTTPASSHAPITVAPSVRRTWVWDYPIYEGPTTSGQRVLVVTRSSGALALASLDAENGVVKWTVSTSLSAIPPAVLAPPAAADGRVLVLTPKTRAFHGYGVGLEGIDVNTGHVSWSLQGAFAVFDAPTTCTGPSGSEAFCVIVTTSLTGQLTFVELDPATGKVLEKIAGISRQIAPSLYENAKAPLSLVALQPAGGIQWVRSLSSLLGSSSYSPDFGWKVRRFGSIIVASFGHVSDGTSQNLSEARSVGISATTGAVLWRDDGAFECGGSALIEGAYLCDESGYIKIASASAPPELDHVHVTITGINPQTGTSTWRDTLGDPDAFVMGSGVAIASTTTVVVTSSSGKPSALNLLTGEIAPAGRSGHYWCPSFTTFDDKTVSGSPDRRSGPEAFSPCDGVRRPVSSSHAAFPPVAASGGGHEIWVTAKGLAAVSSGS